MKIRNYILFSFLIIGLLNIAIFAQGKKNSRPEDNNSEKTSEINAKIPVYFYEFSQPNFIISKIMIEHDEEGAGKITFQKKDFDESLTEPIKLSEKTLEKLKNNWNELNFLDSKENYQSKDRDYPHLGTIQLKMNKNKKERTEEFNWTENANAKILANEYRKIGNQFVWMFDINVSRQNQPLESPKLMKRFDSFLKRNEISDPKQMMPFLKEISDDERVPLITRNYATRLMKRIEKIKEKGN